MQLCQINGGACSPSLYGTLKDNDGEVITSMGKPPVGLRAWFNLGVEFRPDLNSVNWCIFHNAASCRDVPCRGANSCQLADPCQDGACPGTWSPVLDGTWCIEEQGGRRLLLTAFYYLLLTCLPAYLPSCLPTYLLRWEVPRGAVPPIRHAPGTSAPAALAPRAARLLAVAIPPASGLSAALAAAAAEVRNQFVHGHCPSHLCRGQQLLRQPDRLGGCKRGTLHRSRRVSAGRRGVPVRVWGMRAAGPCLRPSDPVGRCPPQAGVRGLRGTGPDQQRRWRWHVRNLLHAAGSWMRRGVGRCR